MWYRLAYFGGSAAILAVLYTLPQSDLFVPVRATGSTARNAALELWLWLAVVRAAGGRHHFCRGL